MRKLKKKVMIVPAIVLSIVIVILILIQITPKPPTREIQNARLALSKATKNKADTYSKKQYAEAKALYDSAMVNWHKENNRFIYFRKYKKVLMFADQAAKKATLASDNSVNSSENLKIKLKGKIASLDDLVKQLDDLFTTYPLDGDVRSHISHGKLWLNEGKIIYAKGQYMQADRKITDAEYLLTESYNFASADLKNYFKSFSTWKRWVDRTLNDSKRNSDYSIIVDKFSRKCYIYLAGARKYEFDAELGRNWVGSKREKGDLATPEGMYRITKKIDTGRTKYYKALLLDYPNDEDRARFREEIQRGTLPANAKIGGLIEIHGNGGKGIDWTEGCIALTDADMNIVFSIAKVGTPVTIIGSMVELKDVLDK